MSSYVTFVIRAVDVHAVPARWETNVHLEVSLESLRESVRFPRISCLEKDGLIRLVGRILSSGRS